MVPPPQTYDQLVAREQNPQQLGLACRDWFWCYNAQSPAASGRRMVFSEHKDLLLSSSDAEKKSWRRT
jgi:hypothetical protein